MKNSDKRAMKLANILSENSINEALDIRTELRKMSEGKGLIADSTNSIVKKLQDPAAKKAITLRYRDLMRYVEALEKTILEYTEQ